MLRAASALRGSHAARVRLSWASSWRLMSSAQKLPEGASAVPLPALSPTMESGRVAAWNLREMDSFEAGSVLAEIETDKATVDFEAQDDGVLAKILINAGEGGDIAVGETIAVIADSKDIAEAVNKMDLSFLTSKSSSTPSTSSESSASTSTSSASTQAAADEGPVPDKQLVSPAAAAILATFGVDAKKIHGSAKSPSGTAIVSKEDAVRAVEGKKPVDQHSAAPQKQAQEPKQAQQKQPQAQQQTQQKQPQGVTRAAANGLPESEPEREYEDIPLTNMRKVIASRLSESKQSRPHFYATIDCEIDAILKMRKELKATLGSAPSINDMILKAAALALRDVPTVNCRVEPDGSIVQNSSVDVAVAVATPTGLITPIVKNTDQKGVMQISADMKDLAGRARSNKLKLEEFQGGSFAVSNLGMFGINDFTAVISPPHSAIMAVGGGRQEFVCPTDDPADMRVVNVLTVQVSADRRVVDDRTLGQYLQVFQAYMSKPMLMSL
mmetsp:Transcript_5257/g.10883  ORF Transcript_5257/g.10883 Transcript_5257/m.10883 type:complete len:498 (-) Transcript_5257:997-2490(-)